MFKVNNKDTRTTPLASFWYLYCKLGMYLTPCSSISIVNIQQVNAWWVLTKETLKAATLTKLGNKYMSEVVIKNTILVS